MKGLLLAALLAPLMGYGQTWPTKPIRWIVPYTGGGLTDVVTRVVTQKMQGPLGQPIVVDNRPGANSILGSDLAAKAPPDGYTMVTVIAGYAANVTLYSGRLPFDPMKDLVPISLAAVAPLIMTVNPGLPAKDVKELIAYAKVNPGKLKALGMFSAKRLSAYPDVPTLAEAGGPALESSTWVLFMAPGGTPREIVNRLATEAGKALKDPEVRARLDQTGIEPVGNSPE